MSCPFCDLIKGKGIKKNFKNQFLSKTKHWYIVLDKNPYIKGHILLIHDKHNHYYELPKNSLEDLNDAFNQIENYYKKLKGREIKNKYVIAMNENRKFWDENNRPHFHFHIIPRYEYSSRDKKDFLKWYPHVDEPDPGLWWLGSIEYHRNNTKSEILHKMVEEAYREMKKKNC